MAGHNFKVVLLGEGCVGKTSTVLRYVENKFESKHLSTLQGPALQASLGVSRNIERATKGDSHVQK